MGKSDSESSGLICGDKKSKIIFALAVLLLTLSLVSSVSAYNTKTYYLYESNGSDDGNGGWWSDSPCGSAVSSWGSWSGDGSMRFSYTDTLPAGINSDDIINVTVTPATNLIDYFDGGITDWYFNAYLGIDNDNPGFNWECGTGFYTPPSFTWSSPGAGYNVGGVNYVKLDKEASGWYILDDKSPLITVTVTYAGISLTAYTDRSLYDPAENVTVIGRVANDTTGAAVEGANISIDVVDPNSATVYSTNATSESDGSFSDSFTLDANAVPGTYTMNMQATDLATGKTSVVVSKTFRVGSLDIAIDTSKVYRKGDVISARVTYQNGSPVTGGYLTANITNATATIAQDLSAAYNASTGLWDIYTISPTPPYGEWQITAIANDGALPVHVGIFNGSIQVARVVRAGETLTYEDTSETLDSDLIVEDGGILNIINSTIDFSPAGTYDIIVRGGSKLNITNSSVTNYNEMLIQNGSTLFIDPSVVKAAPEEPKPQADNTLTPPAAGSLPSSIASKLSSLSLALLNKSISTGRLMRELTSGSRNVSKKTHKAEGDSQEEARALAARAERLSASGNNTGSNRHAGAGNATKTKKTKNESLNLLSNAHSRPAPNTPKVHSRNGTAKTVEKVNRSIKGNAERASLALTQAHTSAHKPVSKALTAANKTRTHASRTDIHANKTESSINSEQIRKDRKALLDARRSLLNARTGHRTIIIEQGSTGLISATTISDDIVVRNYASLTITNSTIDGGIDVSDHSSITVNESSTINGNVYIYGLSSGNITDSDITSSYFEVYYLSNATAARSALGDVLYIDDNSKLNAEDIEVGYDVEVYENASADINTLTFTDTSNWNEIYVDYFSRVNASNVAMVSDSDSWLDAYDLSTLNIKNLTVLGSSSYVNIYPEYDGVINIDGANVDVYDIYIYDYDGEKAYVNIKNANLTASNYFYVTPYYWASANFTNVNVTADYVYFDAEYGAWINFTDSILHSTGSGQDYYAYYGAWINFKNTNITTAADYEDIYPEASEGGWIKFENSNVRSQDDVWFYADYGGWINITGSKFRSGGAEIKQVPFTWYSCNQTSSAGDYIQDDDEDYYNHFGDYYSLPFIFPYFGRNIEYIDFNTNGMIELLESGEDCNDCYDYGTHYDGDMGYYEPVDAVFASNDDLQTDDLNSDYAAVCSFGDKVVVEWQGSTYDDYDSANYPINMQVVLFENGSIMWNFNYMNFSQWGYDMYSGLYAYEEDREADVGYLRRKPMTSYLFSPSDSETLHNPWNTYNRLDFAGYDGGFITIDKSSLSALGDLDMDIDYGGVLNITNSNLSSSVGEVWIEYYSAGPWVNKIENVTMESNYEYNDVSIYADDGAVLDVKNVNASSADEIYLYCYSGAICNYTDSKFDAWRGGSWADIYLYASDGSIFNLTNVNLHSAYYGEIYYDDGALGTMKNSDVKFDDYGYLYVYDGAVLNASNTMLNLEADGTDNSQGYTEVYYGGELYVDKGLQTGDLYIGDDWGGAGLAKLKNVNLTDGEIDLYYGSKLYADNLKILGTGGDVYGDDGNVLDLKNSDIDLASWGDFEFYNGANITLKNVNIRGQDGRKVELDNGIILDASNLNVSIPAGGAGSGYFRIHDGANVKIRDSYIDIGEGSSYLELNGGVDAYIYNTTINNDVRTDWGWASNVTFDKVKIIGSLSTDDPNEITVKGGSNITGGINVSEGGWAGTGGKVTVDSSSLGSTMYVEGAPSIAVKNATIEIKTDPTAGSNTSASIYNLSATSGATVTLNATDVSLIVYNINKDASSTINRVGSVYDYTPVEADATYIVVDPGTTLSYTADNASFTMNIWVNNATLEVINASITFTGAGAIIADNSSLIKLINATLSGGGSIIARDNSRIIANNLSTDKQIELWTGSTLDVQNSPNSLTSNVYAYTNSTVKLVGSSSASSIYVYDHSIANISNSSANYLEVYGFSKAYVSGGSSIGSTYIDGFSYLDSRDSTLATGGSSIEIDDGSTAYIKNSKTGYYFWAGYYVPSPIVIEGLEFTYTAGENKFECYYDCKVRASNVTMVGAPNYVYAYDIGNVSMTGLDISSSSDNVYVYAYYIGDMNITNAVISAPGSVYIWPYYSGSMNLSNANITAAYVSLGSDDMATLNIQKVNATAGYWDIEAYDDAKTTIKDSSFAAASGSTSYLYADYLGYLNATSSNFTSSGGDIYVYSYNDGFMNLNKVNISATNGYTTYYYPYYNGWLDIKDSSLYANYLEYNEDNGGYGTITNSKLTADGSAINAYADYGSSLDISSSDLHATSNVYVEYYEGGAGTISGSKLTSDDSYVEAYAAEGAVANIKNSVFNASADWGDVDLDYEYGAWGSISNLTATAGDRLYTYAYYGAFVDIDNSKFTAHGMNGEGDYYGGYIDYYEGGFGTISNTIVNYTGYGYLYSEDGGWLALKGSTIDLDGARNGDGDLYVYYGGWLDADSSTKIITGGIDNYDGAYSKLNEVVLTDGWIDSYDGAELYINKLSEEGPVSDGYLDLYDGTTAVIKNANLAINGSGNYIYIDSGFNVTLENVNLFSGSDAADHYFEVDDGGVLKANNLTVNLTDTNSNSNYIGYGVTAEFTNSKIDSGEDKPLSIFRGADVKFTSTTLDDDIYIGERYDGCCTGASRVLFSSSTINGDVTSVEGSETKAVSTTILGSVSGVDGIVSLQSVTPLQLIYGGDGITISATGTEACILKEASSAGAPDIYRLYALGSSKLYLNAPVNISNIFNDGSSTVSWNAAPNVTITYPADGATINIFDDLVNGTASDDLGIDYVTVSLNGGAPTTASFSSGKYHAWVSYIPNSINTLSVAAYDVCTQETSTEISVNVLPNTGTVYINTTAGTPEPFGMFINYADFEASIVTDEDVNGTATVTGSRDGSSLGVNDLNSTTAAYGFGANSLAIGKYYKIDTSDNLNGTSGNISSVLMKVYYTMADLDMNGDGDYSDVGDVLPSSLKLFWYNESNGMWYPLTAPNDYEPIGPKVNSNGINTVPNGSYLGYVWANLTHFSVYGLGGSVSTPPSSSPSSSGGASSRYWGVKPNATIVANSIDKALAEDFFGFLKNEGIEISIVDASQFEKVKTSKFLIILGGPDAPEGIGEIVKQLLVEDEQNFLRAKGNRKMYTLTNKYATGQVIHILAGSDRNETRNAHAENKASVSAKIKE